MKKYPTIDLEYLDVCGYNDLYPITEEFEPATVHISGYLIGCRVIKGVYCYIIAQEVLYEEDPIEVRDVTCLPKKYIVKKRIKR